MISLSGQRALVLGRDPSGEAAVALLRRRGADVAWQAADAEAVGGPVGWVPDLVVVSAGCTASPPLARALAARGTPVVAERELAFQQAFCLHAAVTGAAGKSTTAALIAHLLRGVGRRVEVADAIDKPASTLVEGSRELDLIVHVVGPGELDHFAFFRPVVGVLLNVASEADAGGGTREQNVRRFGRLFASQQAFDWAIVQAGAMALCQAAGVVLPGKRITFGAISRQADLGVERGLLVSRLEGWVGPLWDMERGHLQGPHFAENALAALAVGRVLRVALDEMTGALSEFRPGPGRGEELGEADGVRFVHDGRAGTLEAVAAALHTLAPTPPDEPFIWLIAGGDGGTRQFHDLGPVLSPRVKQAIVFGEAAPSMRAAWQLFTPCSTAPSLLDAANRAVEQATRGDVILYSPACPGAPGSSGPGRGTDPFREVAVARVQTAAGTAGNTAAAAGSGRGADAPGAPPIRMFRRPPFPPESEPWHRGHRASLSSQTPIPHRS